MSNTTNDKGDIISFLKEAHDHGYGIGESNLGWSIEKSWAEFLKQYNLVESWQIHLAKEAKTKHRKIAKDLNKAGFSMRQIARKLGYKSPGSIHHLLNS